MRKINSIIGVLMMSMCLCACTSTETEQDTTEKEAESTVEVEEAETISSMPDFSTVDLDGNEVTEAIFSQADLTVVNFWATYCGPCVNELPELGEWASQMSENVQIIGILVDVGNEEDDEFSVAQQIVEKTGADYTHLAASGDFDDIVAELIGVPTTYFVNRDGEMVGDPVIGADVPKYQEFVEEYLNDLQ